MYWIFRKMLWHRGVTATEVAEKVGIYRGIMRRLFVADAQFGEVARLADTINYKVAFVPAESLEELPEGTFFYKEYRPCEISDVIIDDEVVVD